MPSRGVPGMAKQLVAVKIPQPHGWSERGAGHSGGTVEKSDRLLLSLSTALTAVWLENGRGAGCRASEPLEAHAVRSAFAGPGLPRTGFRALRVRSPSRIRT